MAGNTVTCPPSPVGFVTTEFFRVTIEATAVQCGTFPNTATAVGEVAALNPLRPFFPFSIQDTEVIIVEGCEGAGAAGGGPVTLETENEAESGAVDLSGEVSNEGDYASQCLPAEQLGQTGNAQNAPGFLQDAGEADDFEAGGIGLEAEPENTTDCASEVQQASGDSG